MKFLFAAFWESPPEELESSQPSCLQTTNRSLDALLLFLGSSTKVLLCMPNA